MNLLRTHWLAALAAIVMLSGCGEGGPDVQMVKGKVTLDGDPIEGVTVSFSPMGATGGTPAVGTTDANGMYTLTATKGGTFGKGAGAGQYSVGFSKVIAGAAPTEEETQRLMDDPNYGIEENSGQPSGQMEVENAIPDGYRNPLTSGFTVTIKEGANEDFNFDLEKNFQAK